MSTPIVSADDEDQPAGLWRDAWSRLLANKLALIGLVIVAMLAFVAAFGPWLTPYDFLQQRLDLVNAPPSWAHWLGTDDLGRDIASRIIYGARTAMIVAVLVTAASALIGVVLGALAGYLGGRFDAFIMWVTDVTMSIPNILLVVVLNTSLKGPLTAWWDRLYLATLNPFFRDTTWIDFILVFGSMSLILWPPYARLIRSQVLSVRSRNYVRAAVALGLPTFSIIRRHIVPNVMGPLIISVSTGLGTAMVMESSFSFLGIGLKPPMPSWGNMISDGLRVWSTYPHLLAAPAAVLGIATIAFSFLGDGLNDALNPRGKR